VEALIGRTNFEVKGVRGQWRVIAYTYNRQDQAQHKSETVAQKHLDLQPEVFTHRPCALSGRPGRPNDAGGSVGAGEKSGAEGLPHDTYAQNYTGSRPDRSAE
jgi:hypothetical protein